MPAGAPPGTPRRRPWVRPLASRLGLFLLALAGSAIAVTNFGAQTYHWKAFDVEVGIAPALRGQTRLIFTPLGDIRARTHRTPLALNVGLQGVSFDEMKALIVKPPPRAQLEKDFERSARRIFTHFSLCQVGLGALGALIAPLLLRPRRLRGWLFAGITGGGFVAAMLLATVFTFDRKAFEAPTYTGSLREANTVIGLAKEAFVNAQALSDKLRTVAGNLNTLYGRIQAGPGVVADEDTIRVLHISDIHNNPASVGFVRELTEKFAVSAVIDTGDLTDFGTPIETALSRGIERLNVPYVFVAGNHDSEAIVRAVRGNRNAVVLEGEMVTVAGLSLLGSPDPSSRRPGLGDVNSSEAAIAEAGETLLRAVERSPLKPDIVCVHNPRQAQPLIGKVPLVLCGHMHRLYLETEAGTVVCNAGTTGAAGLRYFDKKQGVPFSAAILTFSRPPDARLLFVDQVVLDGSLNEYSISRRTFTGAGPDAPPAVTEAAAAMGSP